MEIQPTMVYEDAYQKDYTKRISFISAVLNFYTEFKIKYVTDIILNAAPFVLVYLNPAMIEIFPIFAICLILFNMANGFDACRHAVNQQFRQKAYRG